MKTSFLYLVAILLLGLSARAPAQNEPVVGPFDGIQSSLGEFLDSAGENYESLKQMYDEEFIRLAWLFGSDIRMKMNAEFEGIQTGGPITGSSLGIFWLNEEDHEGSLYAEFDWQNMAESMRAKSSEYSAKMGIGFLGTTTVTEAKDFTMYVDAQGYWYVPQEKYGYVRVNLIEFTQDVAKTLEVGLELAIEAKVTEILDQLAVLAIMGSMEDGNEWMKEFIPNEMIGAYTDPDPDKSVVGELLKQKLEKMVKLQFEQISNLPPLIHFAFIISPTLARSQFNVQEESVSFMGQVLSTKMTVVSGKDAGAVVIFDRYGRLIHLIDPDGDTATYRYDKDVTVNIPPAMSIDLGALKNLSLN